ncbi:hypothetical protein Golax_022784 [Gossypium laxum]|uniref:Uncharacterized protein n=1 Tax=Gossypium laxum TaxID=34288 RepID=A0A7J9B217_9ROSI|nr:hypothetical protein [Gossypium laxum]
MYQSCFTFGGGDLVPTVEEYMLYFVARRFKQIEFTRELRGIANVFLGRI